ncbi:MAG: transposase [Proteobacteria bacterium]|nr:transposase [Pseudomonadota bacterium]
MARPLRIEYPGALYHVTSRGNGRAPIYLDDEDREQFLATYAEMTLRMNWRCHAYCLMDNHYHLLIETPEGNLSKGMRQLNGVYTQRFNRRHARTGHVFEGRYKAILVERDSHLKELCRYVVLNPVRAGMVKQPGQWRWSSYSATLGVAANPHWLERAWLLAQFGGDAAQYEKFVMEGIGMPGVWGGLRHQIYLGGENFVQDMLLHAASVESIAEVPQDQRRAPETLQQYAERNADPKCAMADAYLTGGYTLAEIARYFGVHYTTVSRVVRTHEKTK